MKVWKNMYFLNLWCSCCWILLEGTYEQLWHHVTSADLWSNVAVDSGPLYGWANVPAHLSLWIFIQWTVPPHRHTHTYRLTYAYSQITDLARMNLFEALGPVCMCWSNAFQMHVCTLKRNFKCLTDNRAHIGTYFYFFSSWRHFTAVQSKATDALVQITTQWEEKWKKSGQCQVCQFKYPSQSSFFITHICFSSLEAAD